MKKIDSSLIIAGKKYRPTKKGLDFLQQAYAENFEDVVKSMIGDTYDSAVGYVLHGCLATLISGDDYSLTAGAIFFNGEIYRVDAIATIALADTGILNITITNDPVADPSKMTDDSIVNIHNIRKLVLSNGVADSGDINLDDLVYISELSPESESWHLVGDVGEPAFQNSWTSPGTLLGDPVNEVSFKKRGTTLMLRGMAYKAVTVTTSIIFTLPVGYRPSVNIFKNISYVGADHYLWIKPSGDVVLYAGTATSFAFLDGFYIEIE